MSLEFKNVIRAQDIFIYYFIYCLLLDIHCILDSKQSGFTMIFLLCMETHFRVEIITIGT